MIGDRPLPWTEQYPAALLSWSSPLFKTLLFRPVGRSRRRLMVLNFYGCHGLEVDLGQRRCLGGWDGRMKSDEVEVPRRTGPPLRP